MFWVYLMFFEKYYAAKSQQTALLTFACSKSTIETLENGTKYI